MSEQYRQMSGPTHDLYQRIAQLESQLTEARAELMLAETSVADKCIQIDELQDSYTALVEAVRAVKKAEDRRVAALLKGIAGDIDRLKAMNDLNDAVAALTKHLEDDNAG